MARDALQTLGRMVTAGGRERPEPLRRCPLRHRLRRRKASGVTSRLLHQHGSEPHRRCEPQYPESKAQTERSVREGGGCGASVAPRQTVNSPASFHSIARTARGPFEQHERTQPVDACRGDGDADGETRRPRQRHGEPRDHAGQHQPREPGARREIGMESSQFDCRRCRHSSAWRGSGGTSPASR